jgi:hypothetical protein
MYYIVFDDGEMINLDTFIRFVTAYNNPKEIMGFDVNNKPISFNEKKSRKIINIIKYHMKAIDMQEEAIVMRGVKI